MPKEDPRGAYAYVWRKLDSSRGLLEYGAGRYWYPGVCGEKPEVLSRGDETSESVETEEEGEWEQERREGGQGEGREDTGSWRKQWRSRRWQRQRWQWWHIGTKAASGTEEEEEEEKEEEEEEEKEDGGGKRLKFVYSRAQINKLSVFF